MEKKWKNTIKAGGLMALPSIAGISLFYIMPLLEMAVRAFIRNSDKVFVGFENYHQVFGNHAFRLASGNTVLFMAVSVPLLIVLSMLFSNLLVHASGFFAYARRAYVLPLAVPAAAVALFWKAFWGKKGLLNLFTHMEIDWLQSGWGVAVLVCVFLWKYFGYTVILWIGGIRNLEQEMLEAAQAEGAGQWQVFFKIILPNMKGTFFTIYTLSLINSSRIFRETYALVGDYPHNSMYLMQNLFNNWLRNFEFDKLAAGGSIYLAAMVVLIVPAGKALRDGQ